MAARATTRKNSYGEPTFRRTARTWSGSMGGQYSTKAEAVKAARQHAKETGREVRVWTEGGGKRETLTVNPAKFDRCVKAVKRKGGAANAYAVCRSALKGKRNPFAVSHESTYNGIPLKAVVKTFQSREAAERFARKKNEKRSEGMYIVREVPKSNPAAGAAEVFEEFHGYKPTEVVKVTKERHHHKHLAAAGDRVGLLVISLKDEERKIEGLGDAVLAFNEAKNQLFIQGGDQRMTWNELKKFGATEEHELQTLGQLKGIGYFTNKTHLGDEGGEAIYSHIFRTTNEWGRHITVKIARYPDLIYRVLDEQFEISGGSYTILREGIDK